MLDHLRAASEGLSRRETAARLGISLNTVCVARRQILRRLAARDMSQAVTFAMRDGWLS